MKYTDKGVEGLKIAYVGGGSRGWAWGLMSDLVGSEDISGEVALYDIDLEAAQHNEIIGNMFNNAEGAKSKWTYKACPTIDEALTGADFVVISILPGTFDEMHSDVHTPEKVIDIEVRNNENSYVSRGGLKLEKALDFFKADVSEKIAR